MMACICGVVASRDEEGWLENHIGEGHGPAEIVYAGTPGKVRARVEPANRGNVEP